jgi:hypothetical protein
MRSSVAGKRERLRENRGQYGARRPDRKHTASATALLQTRSLPATSAKELFSMNALLERLGDYDHRPLMAVLERRRRRLDRVMRSLTRLADPVPATAFATALAVGPPDVRPIGLLALGTLVMSHLMVQVAKRTAARPRPHVDPFEVLIKTPTCFSFPSGHAAAGLSIGLPVALALWGPLGALASPGGAPRGCDALLSRGPLPGDVLAGWALALVAFLILA